jgi:hypothetical protein
MIRDTRRNQFFPTDGEKLEFPADFFMQSPDSKYSFQAYRLIFNQHHGLSRIRSSPTICYHPSAEIVFMTQATNCGDIWPVSTLAATCSRDWWNID